MSSPPNALPPHWVDRLFERLAALYGVQRVSAMWQSTDIAAVKTLWGEQLGRFQPATIAAALQRLVDAGDGWPPTLPEFVELCRQAALGRQLAQDLNALPAPGQGHTDVAAARANLERIRRLMRGSVKVVA
jgi:hypothetical protein